MGRKGGRERGEIGGGEWNEEIIPGKKRTKYSFLSTHHPQSPPPIFLSLVLSSHLAHSLLFAFASPSAPFPPPPLSLPPRNKPVGGEGYGDVGGRG